MLDRVPFRSTRRVVAHRNGEAVGSGNGLVETVFPKAWSVAIAASAVTEQQDFLHAGIGGPAEFRSVGGSADHDRSAIPNRLIESIGRNQGRCVAPEIVLVDLFGLFLPGLSRILKVADEFLFLRIQAQNRTAGIFESLAEVGDQFELSVAVGMLGLRDAFPVDAK